MMKTRTNMNGEELNPKRKDQRNAVRRILIEGAPIAIYREAAKLKKISKSKLDAYLNDLFDILKSEDYWIYEEACDAAGFCS